MKEQETKISWGNIIAVFLGYIVLSQGVEFLGPNALWVYLFFFIFGIPMFFVGYYYGTMGFMLVSVAILITQQATQMHSYSRVLFLFMFLLAPGFMGMAYREKYRLRSVFFQGALILFIGVCLAALGFQNETGTMILQELKNQLHNMSGQIQQVLIQMKMDGKTIDSVDAYITDTIKVLPSSMIILCGLGAFLLLQSCRAALKKLQKLKNKPVLVSPIRWSKIDLGSSYLVAFGITFFAYLLLEEVEKGSVYTIGLLNMYVVFLFLSAVQGGSMLYYLFKKHLRIPKYVLIGIFAIAILLIQGPILLAFSIAGVLDLLFDFREIRKPISS